MNLEILKDIFIKRYGNCMFLKRPIEVLVTLTKDQFKDLNDDMLKSVKSSSLLIMDESDMFPNDNTTFLFTRISVPNFCEFIVEIGNEFRFALLDKEQEHGDETL